MQEKITPPTSEEAELWKQVAADISGATSYITIEVAKGDWKTAQDIVNKLYASLQQKYSLSPRSEQNTDLPIEEIKKNFAGYINWCGNGLKPDILQLDNLFRYIRKSGCILTQNGFKWGAEQNSEAVELLNWMAKNHVICAESANGDASFVLNEKIATKEDLYQEFQLFKQNP